MKSLKFISLIFLLIIPSIGMGRFVFPGLQNNYFPSKSCNQKEITSGKFQTLLIELYTSEGCSSCPPADRWINSLYEHKNLWKEFVPIKFHVDYWNYLGWKDPFSQKDFTKRQKRYSKEWKSNQIYTPGFVVNGTEWKYLIPPKLASSKFLRPGVLKAKRRKNNKFNVSFNSENFKSRKLKIFGAVIGHGLPSHIKRGENMGTKFQHNFVVLDIKSQVVNSRSGKYKTQFEFQSPKLSPKEYSVAFWVTHIGNLRPIQAVGGCTNKL